MDSKPELKTIIKPLAWLVVLTGWLFYGFITWMAITHPHPEKDPVTDFQEGLKQARHDWGFSIFMLISIVVYAISWAYIKENRKKKGKPEK